MSPGDATMPPAIPPLTRPVAHAMGCFALASAAAALLLFAGACAAPDRATSAPVAATAGADDAAPIGASAAAAPDVPRGNADLLIYIAEQPILLAEPGYRAAYVLWKGEPFTGDFDELSRVLADGKIAGSWWELSADEPLDRAAVGYLVCRAGELNSGLNWQLTGLGRYAWRELVYHGIARASSEWNLISGGEFLGVLLKTEEYLASIGRASWKRSELGGDAGGSAP